MVLMSLIGLSLSCLISDLLSRGGSRGPGPLFLAKLILFFTLYTMSEKIFLQLNFDFIVAEIRGVFGSVGSLVCVCVCVCVCVIPYDAI